MSRTLLGLLFVLLAIPARAQVAPATPADARWTPWLGCWELTTENVRAASRTNALALQALTDGRPRICVTPTTDGARFVTTVAEQTAVEYTIVPNGADRPLAESECRGTQQAEWSGDGLRLFARARLTCDGDKGTRRVSGLSLIAPNGNWVDLQAVEIDGRESVRVRRYRRADQTGSIVRTGAGSPLSLDDVKEASGKVSSLALEAALVETNAGYDLTSRKLLDLDAAGVSDTVIDLIVALSYPEKFVVERTSRATLSSTYADPFSLGWAFGHSLWYDDFYSSPYAYSRAGAFPLNEGGGLLIVPVGGGAIGDPQPSGTGRVVDGQGYTRVRARDAESTASAGTGAQTSTVSGSAGSTASAPPPASTGSSESSSSGSGSGSSGGSTTSSGGSSTGSSGGETGRTAVPR